jgi:hypothetical protein
MTTTKKKQQQSKLKTAAGLAYMPSGKRMKPSYSTDQVKAMLNASSSKNRKKKH